MKHSSSLYSFQSISNRLSLSLSLLQLIFLIVSLWTTSNQKLCCTLTALHKDHNRCQQKTQFFSFTFSMNYLHKRAFWSYINLKRVFLITIFIVNVIVFHSFQPFTSSVEQSSWKKDEEKSLRNGYVMSFVIEWKERKEKLWFRKAQVFFPEQNIKQKKLLLLLNIPSLKNVESNQQ